MRHPKRFCVKCNSDQAVTVRAHRTYEMYHCRRCGDEITRVGDGGSGYTVQHVVGLDDRRIPDDARHALSLLELVRQDPDVLSDEQTVWPAREDEADRQAWRRQMMVAFALLTPRQQAVVEAVRRAKGQAAAAKMLGISQQAVSRTLQQIQKKLRRDGCISGKDGF